MFKKLLPLLLILLLAAALRVYNLDKVPPALFGDEVDVGYQAFSVLKTGEDLSGQFMPVYMRSIAEYRAPLFLYSAVPFVGVFGLNEWGVRLPAAFWGVLGVWGIYLLAGAMFNRKIALASAFILAISPWHLQYSRAAFEVTMQLTFLTFATYFFLLGLKRRYFLLPSALLYGLTIYIYQTALVFTPLLLLCLVIIFRRELLKRVRLVAVSVLILFVLALPTLFLMVKGEAGGRFALVSIFQDTVLLDKINLARKGEIFTTPTGNKTVLNGAQEAIFYNKPMIFGQVFTLNYLRAFSFNFLFAQGDPNLRQSIQEMGELYLFELIFIIFGLIGLLKKFAGWRRDLLLSWLLLAPIPASLTYDGGFHATRLFLMLPPLAMLSGYGLTEILSWWKTKYRLILPVVAILMVFNIVFYFHRYYVHYPVESWRFWQIGYKQALTYVKDNQDKYSRIVINDSYEPGLIRYLFYTRFDPATFHKIYKNDYHRDNILPGINGFKLTDKVYFGVLEDSARQNGGFNKVMQPGMLYLASARDEIDGFKLSDTEYDKFRVVKTVYDPTGQPIFYLLAGK